MAFCGRSSETGVWNAKEVGKICIRCDMSCHFWGVWIFFFVLHMYFYWQKRITGIYTQLRMVYEPCNPLLCTVVADETGAYYHLLTSADLHGLLCSSQYLLQGRYRIGTCRSCQPRRVSPQGVVLLTSQSRRRQRRRRFVSTALGIILQLSDLQSLRSSRFWSQETSLMQLRLLATSD